MSDYGSVSKVFEESLKEHLEPVVRKEAGLETESGADILSVTSDVIQFMDRIVQDWVRNMDDESREAIGELFAKLENISTAEVIHTMHNDGHSSPFSVVAKLFEDEQEPGHVDDEDIIEIVDHDDPDELRE